MKYQKFNLTRFSYLTFLTFFGTGLSPKAPGTVGSLATIPLILFIAHLKLSFALVLTLIFVLFLIACPVADYAQKKENVYDPGWIVIDEVIGMLITWSFVFPRVDLISLGLTFILFRFFDIIKIFPASWFDQKMKSGTGTIIDDVISAIYAGTILYFGQFFQLLPNMP